MMLQNKFLLLFSFLITFQMFFIGAFLVTSQKGKKKSNRLLGLIFILMGWNIGDLTMQLSGFDVNFGFFQLLDDGFILLYGPLFYLYIQLVIYKSYDIPRKYWVHLVPYILFTSLIFLAQVLPVDVTEQSTTEGTPIMVQVVSFLLYVHILIYIGFGFASLKGYRNILKNQFSKVDHINLDWLSFALTTLAVVTIISLIHNVFVLSGSVYIYSISISLLLIFLMYFVNRVIFKALRQPEIFAGIDQESVIKYAGSSLTQEQAQSYNELLSEVLRVEKLYRNPQLSIHDLAERLGVSSKLLSQVINQSFDKSFFDLINSYRIQEAQQILKERSQQKPTVLEVMYEVGFNSKSSFNTAFKKATGKTPSEYRKNLS